MTNSIEGRLLDSWRMQLLVPFLKDMVVISFRSFEGQSFPESRMTGLGDV
jgi:hypothetical protein